jgi:hypothetical protein
VDVSVGSPAAARLGPLLGRRRVPTDVREAARTPVEEEERRHRIQQLIHEKAIFAPLWELVSLNGVGPRVEESGLGLIPGYPYSAPYEDLKVRSR